MGFMDFIKKVGSFGSGIIKKLGQFTSGGSSGPLGHFKSAYDGINNMTGGSIGTTLEGLPYGIGGILAKGGNLLKASHGASELVSNGRKLYGGGPESTEQRDNRRERMGLVNL